MSESLTLCNYRLAQEHIDKLKRDAETLARLTGARPNDTAAIRAAIEFFDPAAYLSQVMRLAEARQA